MTMINSGLKGLKHNLASLENDLISYTSYIGGFRTTIFIINSFFYLSRTSSHLHPLQAANCEFRFLETFFNNIYKNPDKTQTFSEFS